MARGSVVTRILKDGRKRYDAVLWVRRSDGTRKQIWKSFELKRDADSFLNDRSKEVREDEYFEPSKIAFEKFAREWMEKYPPVGNRKTGPLKPSTVSAYNCVVEKHLIPFFGPKLVSQIRSTTIERDFKAWLPAHLSSKSQRNILLVLQRMFVHAVKWGYTRSSPFETKGRPDMPGVDLPAASKAKKGRALNPEEINKLLEHCADDAYTVVILAVLSGMRRGEIFGLKWDDIDFETNQIHVERALYWKRGKFWGEQKGYLFVSPKSKESVRKIDMSPKLRRTLLEHKLRSKRSELGLVFSNPDGKPVDPDNFAKDLFRPAVKAAQIGAVRFHDMRHTFGSLKIAQSENLYYVMRQMGHASIQVTIDCYTHELKDTNAKAAAKTDEVIFGSTRENSEAKQES